LPGLVLTKEIGKVLQSLFPGRLTFRGLYGEGSEVVGNFFQLSNQTTLASRKRAAGSPGQDRSAGIEYEEQAREILLREATTIVADKVWRAYGTLRHARR